MWRFKSVHIIIIIIIDSVVTITPSLRLFQPNAINIHVGWY